MPHSIITPLITALTLAGGTATASTGAAAVMQEAGAEPAIATMRVDIWPEYDDPRVLVIYAGRMAPGTETPTELSFVVPEGAQVHMAGGIAANGGHIHADFGSRVRDDGLMEVSYALDVPRFYMEFYYDPFAGGEQRRFTYPVQSPFATDSLIVRIQEPRRAQGFELTPSAVDVAQDRQGLDYDILRFDGVAGGAVTPVTVAYRKADREPSVSAQEVPGAQPTASTTSSPSPWSRARTWVLGLLAAGLFAVGFYRLFSSRREGTGLEDPVAGTRPVDRARHRTGEGKARFCTECGSPVAPSDRFCGQCGHPVRTGVPRARAQ